jgi:signal transduction histidine kinase
LNSGTVGSKKVARLERDLYALQCELRDQAAEVEQLRHAARTMFEASDAANQVKNAFLAIISHELRTPLTALAGYGELLSDGILGDLSAGQRDTVERMRAATNQLTVMIDAILSYSSLEAGRERVVTTSVVPDALVRDVASALEPLARAKGVELQTELPPAGALRSFPSDSDKLRQILVNLCDNALKFTPRGGTVTVRAADEGTCIRFDVHDTGIGIAEEHLPRLFQPFVQLDAGLTRRFGGAGLGLHISSQLAALLDGRIEVHSHVGTGSTFSVIIPQ